MSWHVVMGEIKFGSDGNVIEIGSSNKERSFDNNRLEETIYVLASTFRSSISCCYFPSFSNEDYCSAAKTMNLTRTTITVENSKDKPVADQMWTNVEMWRWNDDRTDSFHSIEGPTLSLIHI